MDRSAYRAAGQEEDVSGIARRVSQITVSAIKQMPVLASKVEGCLSLGQGVPSFPTPEFICQAVGEALVKDEAVGKYSLQPGLPMLKEEVARRLERDKGVQVDPDTEIFISCGGMEALATGLCTIVERGDEVLLPSPSYSSHIEQVLFAEGRPVFVPLREEEGWALDVEGFRRAVTPRTKAIVLCNPMNPTGAVFAEEQVRALAELVYERDLFLVADEAYDFLFYEGNAPFSPIRIPEIRDRLLSCYSFSKMYCMTGWRVGYMVAPQRLIAQVLKVHDAFAICAPTIGQFAALAALRATNGSNGPGDRFIRELVSALERRRALACARLERLSGFLAYQKPQGAYYVFPKILPAGLSDMDLALRLLYEARVIVIPGSGFGPTGGGHLRLSFGAREEEIEQAFDGIEAWARGLRLL